MSGLTEQQRFWKGHLEAAASDGVTLREYARRHGFSVHAMYTARQRIRNRESTRSTFVRVSETRIEQINAPQAPMTVRLPNGVSLSVPYDSTTVVAVLKTLASL